MLGDVHTVGAACRAPNVDDVARAGPVAGVDEPRVLVSLRCDRDTGDREGIHRGHASSVL